MARRWRRVALAVLAAAALVLAACARGQEQQPAAEKFTPPEDPVGVLTYDPGEPIVIAFALVMEGPNATLGEDSRRGIQIALEHQGGELLGRRIRLVGENTGCNAEGGQAAAQKLVTNPKIAVVIGTSCSSEAQAAAPVLCRAGIPMISPSNTAPSLTAPDRPQDYWCYARTAHNDKVQGAVAARFAYEQLGARKAATIHDGSPYAEQLARVFAETFRSLGGQITNEEAVKEGDVEMKPVLTRIAANRPDVIYYPIFVAEGGHITNQARRVPGLENTALMGADGLFTPEFVKAAGGSPAAGMYLSSPDFSAFNPERYQRLLDTHRELFGGAPLSAFHAHAYDATMIALAAIQQVAVEGPDGTLYIPRRALRDAIYATKDFAGVTGNLTCDQYGDCADPKIAIYQITPEVAANPDQNWPPPKIWSP